MCAPQVFMLHHSGSHKEKLYEEMNLAHIRSPIQTNTEPPCWAMMYPITLFTGPF